MDFFEKIIIEKINLKKKRANPLHAVHYGIYIDGSLLSLWHTDVDKALYPWSCFKIMLMIFFFNPVSVNYIFVLYRIAF